MEARDGNLSPHGVLHLSVCLSVRAHLLRGEFRGARRTREGTPTADRATHEYGAKASPAYLMSLTPLMTQATDLLALLAAHPLLAALTPDERADVAARFVPRSYKRG